eukprot:g2632.t1
MRLIAESSLAIDIAMYTLDREFDHQQILHDLIQDSRTDYNRTPDNCFGGAFRRATVMKEAETEDHRVTTIKIDGGGFFYGGGLFYPTFRGNVSTILFGESGYDAWALGYRDMRAGIGYRGDHTGGKLLGAYIRSAKEASNGTLPNPVVSNLNVSGDPFLSDLIDRYTLIQMKENRTCLFLNLLDPSHVGEPYGPQMFDFSQTLTLVLNEVFQDACVTKTFADGAPPDVVVVYIGGWDLLDSDCHTELQRLRTLLEQNIGAHIFIGGPSISSLRDDDTECGDNGRVGVRLWNNWANEHRAVVPVEGTKGTTIDNVTVNFRRNSDGTVSVLNVSSDPIKIDANIPIDTDVERRVLTYHESVREYLSRPLGRINANVLSNEACDLVVNDGDDVVLSCMVRGRDTPTNITLSRGQADEGVECVYVGPPSEDGHRAYKCGCRVAQCSFGSWATDAFVWKAKNMTGIDIALAIVNGGSFRAQPFLSSIANATVEVSSEDFVEVLAFLNNLVVINVTGANLMAAMTNAISKMNELGAVDLPRGRFLQVSSEVQLQWFFDSNGEPTVSSLVINGVDVDLGAYYTVATSTFLGVSNLDGYEMLAGITTAIDTGVTMYQAVADFVEHMQSVDGEPTTIDTTYLMRSDRIVQLPDIVRIDVGIMHDASSESDRRGAEYAMSLLRILNGSSSARDSSFGNLLEYARVFVHDLSVPCELSESETAHIFRDFHQNQAVPISAMIVSGSSECSNHIKSLARSSNRANITGWHGLVLTPGSISGLRLLENRTEFPNLVRVASSVNKTAIAIAKFANSRQWKRASILASSSEWGNDALGSVRYAIGNFSMQLEIVTTVRASALNGADDDAELWLRELSRSDARVVVVLMEPALQRKLFAAVQRTGIRKGKGYAWISAWLEDDMFASDENTLEGALGLIGFAEVPPSKDYQSDRATAFHEASSSISGQSEITILPLAWAEAALAFAEIFSSPSGQSNTVPFYRSYGFYRTNTIDEAFDASSLYMHVFDGVSNLKFEGLTSSAPLRTTLDKTTADRRGQLKLVNLRRHDAIVEDAGRLRRRALSDVAANWTIVDVAVRFDDDNDGNDGEIVGTADFCDIIFPGDTCEDTFSVVDDEDSGGLSDSLVAVIVSISILCVGFIAYCVVNYRKSVEEDSVRKFKQWRGCWEGSFSEADLQNWFALQERRVSKDSAIPWSMNKSVVWDVGGPIPKYKTYVKSNFFKLLADQVEHKNSVCGGMLMKYEVREAGKRLALKIDKLDDLYSLDLIQRALCDEKPILYDDFVPWKNFLSGYEKLNAKERKALLTSIEKSLQCCKNLCVTKLHRRGVFHGNPSPHCVFFHIKSYNMADVSIKFADYGVFQCFVEQNGETLSTKDIERMKKNDNIYFEEMILNWKIVASKKTLPVMSSKDGEHDAESIIDASCQDVKCLLALKTPNDRIENFLRTRIWNATAFRNALRSCGGEAFRCGTSTKTSNEDNLETASTKLTSASKVKIEMAKMGDDRGASCHSRGQGANNVCFGSKHIDLTLKLGANVAFIEAVLKEAKERNVSLDYRHLGRYESFNKAVHGHAWYSYDPRDPIHVSKSSHVFVVEDIHEWRTREKNTDSQVTKVLKRMRNKTSWQQEKELREGIDIQLGSPFVVKLTETYEVKCDTKVASLPDFEYAIVMEKYDTSLFELLQTRRFAGVLHEIDAVLSIFEKCVACVKSLHKSNILHKDLKPRNFLCKKDSSESGTWYDAIEIALCDLDASQKMDGGEMNYTKYTAAYAPPEFVRKVRTRRWRKLNKAVCVSDANCVSGGTKLTVSASHDVWSLGVILYEMCSGQHLFSQDLADDSIVNRNDNERLCMWKCITDTYLDRFFNSGHGVIDCDEDNSIATKTSTTKSPLRALEKSTQHKIRLLMMLVRKMLESEPTKRIGLDEVSKALKEHKEGESVESPEIPRMQYHGFISHVQAEASGHIANLHHELERSYGVHCWRDVAEKDLTASGMEQGVKDSDVFVLFLTRDYFNRCFCRKELQWALENEKKIVVIMEVDPKYHKFSFEDINWGAWMTWNEKVKKWILGELGAKDIFATANMSSQKKKRGQMVDKKRLLEDTAKIFDKKKDWTEWGKVDWKKVERYHLQVC